MDKKSVFSKKTKQEMVRPTKKVHRGKTTIENPQEEKKLAFNPPPLHLFPEPEQRREDSKN